jgi:hypothetical protein
VGSATEAVCGLAPGPGGVPLLDPGLLLKIFLILHDPFLPS